MRKYLIVSLLLASASALAASDYAREKKWVDEITPAIVVGDPAYLLQNNGHKFLAIYTEARNAEVGVVIVHGIGVHPDWGLIGTLRQHLSDHGYATLSVQMPILAADAEPPAYAATLPEAIERLQLATAFLKDKGYKRIALVSHSMGSSMTRAYMAASPGQIAAWAALGVSAMPGKSDAAITYEGIKIPVLDLYGSRDLPRVLAGAAARRASLAANTASRQVVIADADHFFSTRENDMLKAVKQFLDGIR